jgi:GNAT superfamily N-acetyltransferase
VSCWRIAELERTLVGVVHMFTHVRMPMPNYDPGGWGYVSLLYVQPEHRGNGLGARLLEANEQEARSQGFSKVLLDPTERATPLYHRCGYRRADSYLVHELAPTAATKTRTAAR